MEFKSCHTHLRSDLEKQPVIDELGNILTIDGRIDNHKEFREQMYGFARL
jgi:hypothetical protein